MNEGFSDLLLVGIIALLLGIGLGLVVSRLFFKGPPQNRRMAQQMDELQNEYTRYQAQVNEHFMETAHRMRRLNDSYREMHEHLAQGATRLSSDGDWQEALGAPDLRLKLNRTADSDVEPPRDYAPKSGPQDKGTLAEDFGFNANPASDDDQNGDTPERR
jgi:uncharacterized membrane-anchored protein YhcB (DUF1043 family)